MKNTLLFTADQTNLSNNQIKAIGSLLKSDTPTHDEMQLAVSTALEGMRIANDSYTAVAGTIMARLRMLTASAESKK